MSEPRIVTFPGVYRPRVDTTMLRDAVISAAPDLPPAASWLDVCSGTGALALAAARAGAGRVTAVDVSRRAVQNIRLNAALNRVSVRALRGDLFDPVAGERFEVILANPPYVPAAPGAAASRAARAWDAGGDGRAVLDRICLRAADMLAAGGVLLLVQSSLSDTPRTIEMLERQGLAVETLSRHQGTLGPIAAARRDYLREAGLVGPGDTEDLVVLRATRLRIQARHGHPEGTGVAFAARAAG